jgi:hypothetical protein
MTPEDQEQLDNAEIIVEMWALGERLERMKEAIRDINRQINELP